MTLSVLNQCVQCVCGNDIIISVGGDDEVNSDTAEKWFVTVDIKAINKPKDCCAQRMNIGFNNMMLGVQMYSDIFEILIEVTVNNSWVNE